MDIYEELLYKAGIIPEPESKIIKPEKYILECCGPIELVRKEGTYVCWTCGKVLGMNYIVNEEEPRYCREGEILGASSRYTYKKYRPYKPLTHFREHLRRYLGQRFLAIPDELLNDLRGKFNPMDRNAYVKVKSQMKQLGGKKYTVEVWDKEMRRTELKKYKVQKFYKDIFTIIYSLGGIQPRFNQTNEIFNSYMKLQYEFAQARNQGRLNNRHNMPSHFMILDILLRKHGHVPYYEIPHLKDHASWQNVLNMYNDLKSR